MRRLIVLPASTRNAPGLLTGRGWAALSTADRVVVTCAHPAWPAHLREAGIEADIDADLVRRPDAGAAADALLSGEGAADLTVVWLGDDAPALWAVASAAAERGGWDADLLFASPVAPGAEIVESARIMHELRSPGGDAWSAAQTHASLARYLLEEAHETAEVIAAGAGEDLVDELGDVLFQVVLHARIGTEEETPYSIDDVARALNRKMYRRNPHVFTPDGSRACEAATTDIAAIWAQWDAAKAQENPARGVFDGIPVALPALQRASKVIARARRAGILEMLREHVRALELEAGEEIGRELFLCLEPVVARDEDAESALRTVVARVLAAEATGDDAASVTTTQHP